MATQEVTLKLPKLGLDWKTIRHVFYTALAVWVFGIRLFGIDPLGLRGALPVAWLFDALSLYVLALIFWHMWSWRPKV